MGKVKTGKVKRLAKEIFEKYSKEINENFEKNKALVRQVLEGEISKKIINLIAGYLTILAKQKSEAEKEAESKEANVFTMSTSTL